MALACGGTVAVSPHAGAAEWLISPVVRVARDYTDNPRLLEKGGESSAGIIGEISANVQRRSERFELSLRPGARSARYRDDETLGSSDQYLDAQLKYVTVRSQWDGSVAVTHDTTLTSELGLTGFVQANRRHEGVKVAAGPTFMLTERISIGAQGNWLDSHYPDARNTGLVDYEYRAAALFSSFAATPRSDVSVTMQGGELVVPEQDSRTRDGSLRLGWTYEPHLLWSARFSAGPAYVDASFGDDTGVVFDVDLSRRGELWTSSINAGRNLTPTGRGVLTRRDRVVLGVSRRITEHLTATASAQWIRNQDLLQQLDVAFEEVTYGRLDLGLSWRLAEHWSLALALGGATQSYESRSHDAESYRASLSMVWNGQPQSL